MTQDALRMLVDGQHRRESDQHKEIENNTINTWLVLRCIHSRPKKGNTSQLWISVNNSLASA